MRGVVMYAPGDVRVENRPEPTILKPTDAIIRLSATCIRGSDLWPYRGADDINEPARMGHEYAGIVEEVGSEVTTIKPGQFVIGSFFASDNTCEICQAGYQSSCINRVGIGSEGAQAERMRVPLADGTSVATSDVPETELVPDFLAASDVLGTGWFAAVAAEAGPGKTVAVVGDGAVGLQAIHSTRLGGHVGYVGVSHDVALPGEQLFFSHVHLHGGPAPVRRFLPELVDRIWNRKIRPGRVFDLELPLDDAAAGYQAMDSRQAIKVLLRP